MKRRRLMLAVPPDLDKTIDRLAEVTGKPRATLVIDLLSEMRTSLDDLARVLVNVRQGRTTAARRALQHMMGNAFADVMASQQPDMFKGKGRSK